jgi:tetratricopeptide (TPR) repeat protein
MFKGSLSEASLPDVLQLLAMGRKSGCLSLAHRGNFGSIYFDAGRITYASIVNRRDRLGERLVQAGAITRETLQRAIEAQALERDARLGDVLVAQGAVTRAMLREHIAVQVQETVYLLYTWHEGTFSFDSGSPPHDDALVAINPESLMLEGARRVDEWSFIEQSVPSFDLVFETDVVTLAGLAAPLAPEHALVLEHLDGTRHVVAVAERSGLAEFEVAKALHEMLALRVVRVVEKREDPSFGGAEPRIDEHRNLGVAFYKARMLDEALREFRRVLDLSPDDVPAAGYCARILLRTGRWEEAATRLQALAALPSAGAATFHNLSLALERLGQYAAARDALAQAMQRSDGSDPRLHTSFGVVSLYLGDADTALNAFTDARALFAGKPSASWFHYAALAAAWHGDTARAREILAEGTGLHASGTLLSNLAAILEQDGSAEDAADAARRALLEPDAPPQASKNLGDVYYAARRYDEAYDAFARASRAAPTLGPDVHLKQGNIALRRRDTAAAADHWRRALELDPSNEIVRRNLETVSATAV